MPFEPGLGSIPKFAIMGNEPYWAGNGRPAGLPSAGHVPVHGSRHTISFRQVECRSKSLVPDNPPVAIKDLEVQQPVRRRLRQRTSHQVQVERYPERERMCRRGSSRLPKGSSVYCGERRPEPLRSTERNDPRVALLVPASHRPTNRGSAPDNRADLAALAIASALPREHRTWFKVRHRRIVVNQISLRFRVKKVEPRSTFSRSGVLSVDAHRHAAIGQRERRGVSSSLFPGEIIVSASRRSDSMSIHPASQQ